MNLSAVTAFVSVLLIDVTLAADNAIVLGTVAAKLPPHLKTKAMLIGVAGAAMLRIIFALFASKLYSIVGMSLAGGFLLLWVAWKLWRELKIDRKSEARSLVRQPQQLKSAVWQILFADVSMSLDNTLAVAGAAGNHFWILVFGLVTSVALMGVAANLFAKLIERHRWISYLGLTIVTYVSLSMIWGGFSELVNFGNRIFTHAP